MSQADPMPQGRPWQEIAEQVSKEHDSQKLDELVQSLIAALDNQQKSPKPEQKSGKQAA